jgi:hypothetical protein
MSAYIIDHPANKSNFRSGGSGPEDPMLERVVKLEEKVDRIDEALKRLEPAIRDIAMSNKDIKESIYKFSLEQAEMKGKMSSFPTTWTILGIVFTTWAIGSGIVFAIAKFAR